MATHTFIDIQIPEAKRLASLYGVQNDLFSALELCTFLVREYESPHQPREIVDAFSTAILVRYCRAFPPGVRDWPWKDALSSLTAAQQDSHERLRHFRSKHIAHSVNSFEENRVQARYCLERAEDEGITSLACSSSKVVGLSSIDLSEIADLCRSLLKYIDDRIATEQERLLPLVRKIPLAVLRAQAPPPFGTQDFMKPHVPRSAP